jgi:hypothetical protein
MTQSAQSAVNMANITPWAHELRDTEADTMEEPSRGKLNNVGQVATPTQFSARAAAKAAASMASDGGGAALTASTPIGPRTRL